MSKIFDDVKGKVLETVGKRKSGFTAEEVAQKMDLSLDYIRIQLKKLRNEGKVTKNPGRVPVYTAAI